ncbi:MAG: GNAT family N-acetyltransferase [Burkholderiales bacterium]
MRDADLPRTLEILAAWNMAPIAPCPGIPDPERSELNVANSFVAQAGGRVVGVASYIVLNDTLAETASLAVDPAYLHTRVGEMLQRARLREMKRAVS